MAYLQFGEMSFPTLSCPACAVLTTQLPARNCDCACCESTCVLSPWKVFPHSRDPTSLWQKRANCERRRRKNIAALWVWLSAVSAEEEQRPWSFLNWSWGGLAFCIFDVLTSAFLESKKKRHLFLQSQSYCPHNFSCTWGGIASWNKTDSKVSKPNSSADSFLWSQSATVHDREAKGEDFDNCGNSYMIKPRYSTLPLWGSPCWTVALIYI